MQWLMCITSVTMKRARVLECQRGTTRLELDGAETMTDGTYLPIFVDLLISSSFNALSDSSPLLPLSSPRPPFSTSAGL